MLRSNETHHYQKHQEQRKDKDLSVKRGRQVLWKLGEAERHSEPSNDSLEKTVQSMNQNQHRESTVPAPHQDPGQEQEQDRKEAEAEEDGNQSIELQTGDSNKPKRNPFCSRCRNHGKSAQVKGHKRHCEYRDCQCGGCRLVEYRQIVSAAQIKRRRDQKQDEECGRRIEISPPVLVREPSNDPAALIAKTLIGSTATSKQYQIQQQTEQRIPSHGHQLHHPNPQNLSDVLSIAVNPATSSIMPTNPNHHLLQHHHQTTAPSQNGGLLVGANLNQHHQHPLQCPHLNLNHLGQHHHQAISSHLNQTSNVAATIAGAIGCHAPASSTQAANSALSNALQLFNFPNSLLSAGAAASLNAHTNNQHHHHPLNHGHHLANHLAAPSAVFPTSVTAAAAAAAPTTAPPGPANVATTPDSPRPPSIREQINLVEEIYQTFGPRAIYAWLRAEHFDLQKVRDSIEISRASYDNLMDLKSKYRLSGSNNDNHHKQTNFWY